MREKVCYPGTQHNNTIQGSNPGSLIQNQGYWPLVTTSPPHPPQKKVNGIYCCETSKCTNLVSICWLPTTTGVRTYKFFTCTAFWALVWDHLWMLTSKMLALASDWLCAILWYIVITFAFTAANTTRKWDRSGLWNGLIISFMLFVPKIYKTFCLLLHLSHVCQSSTFKVNFNILQLYLWLQKHIVSGPIILQSIPLGAVQLTKSLFFILMGNTLFL